MSNSRGGLGYWLAAARVAARLSLGYPMRPSSLRRWRIGHQMFIVLDQMLLTAVVVLDRALSERDWPRAERSFDRLAQLFLASTAALRHTGDFAPQVYEWIVAEDMKRFYLKPGMSGGNMLDHRMLVDLMRGSIRRHEETIRMAPIAVYDAYLRFEHARATAPGWPPARLRLVGGEPEVAGVPERTARGSEDRQTRRIAAARSARRSRERRGLPAPRGVRRPTAPGGHHHGARPLPHRPPARADLLMARAAAPVTSRLSSSSKEQRP